MLHTTTKDGTGDALLARNPRLPTAKQVFNIFDAIRHGHAKAVKKIVTSCSADTLNQPFDPLDPDTRPVICAVKHERCKILSFLLFAGVDPNVRDADGNTPLHLATACNSLHLVFTLLEHGALRFECNRDGKTPQQLAEEMNLPHIVDQLQRWTSPWDELHKRSVNNASRRRIHTSQNQHTDELLRANDDSAMMDSLIGVLAQKEQRYGPNHAGLVPTLEKLARLFRASKRGEDELQVRIRLAKVVFQTAGRKSLDYVNAMNNLGEAYYAYEKYSSAVGHLRTALKLARKLNANVLKPLENLAFALLENGEHADAWEVFQEALVEREKQMDDPSHPSLAKPLFKMSLALCKLNRFQEAEKHSKRALAIIDLHLGPFHDDVAVSLDNLAKVYYLTGDFKRAEILFRRSLLIRDTLQQKSNFHSYDESAMMVAKNNLAMAIVARKQGKK